MEGACSGSHSSRQTTQCSSIHLYLPPEEKGGAAVSPRKDFLESVRWASPQPSTVALSHPSRATSAPYCTRGRPCPLSAWDLGQRGSRTQSHGLQASRTL